MKSLSNFDGVEGLRSRSIYMERLCNGKMMGAGDFGWAGSIMWGGLLVGLEHNYAIVSTDTGHDNSLGNGEFALDPPDKMIDYVWRAAHLMTVDDIRKRAV